MLENLLYDRNFVNAIFSTLRPNNELFLFQKILNDYVINSFDLSLDVGMVFI